MSKSVSIFEKSGESVVVFGLEEVADKGVGGVNNLFRVIVAAVFSDVGESFGIWNESTNHVF